MLPKKGDLTSKLLGKIIIKRIAEEVNKCLREKQAGFRERRGITEQIFILRNIIE